MLRLAHSSHQLGHPYLSSEESIDFFKQLSVNSAIKEYKIWVS